MTEWNKDDFRGWAQAWMSKWVGTTDATLEFIEDLERFDRTAATLFKMHKAAEDELKAYLKSRLDQ